MQVKARNIIGCSNAVQLIIAHAAVQAYGALRQFELAREDFIESADLTSQAVSHRDPAASAQDTATSPLLCRTLCVACCML